ncbi:MAG: 4Fe-4S binding protein [Chloroflexota bacterium]
MYGKGIIKGLSVTLKRFIDTYLDDFAWWGRRYFNPEGIAHRSSKNTRGIFTVQYPEEKLPVPEEFRYVPFLVYDERGDGGQEIRCTSCGICAKVCPPQCIWIVRTNDPQTGRPVPEPAEFFIDADICMNCGFCSEYCPFDAIIMDHDYEIASYQRSVFNMQQLLKPASYYKSIRPLNYQRNEQERQAKLAAKAAKMEAAS